MKITVAALIAAGIGPTQARQYEQPLAQACERFDINTPARIAAFIGQCAVESVWFTRTEENLRYTTVEVLLRTFPSKFRTGADAAPYLRQPEKLANFVYAGRNGNGNEASGDGWRCRGRGLIHLTGLDNYAEAERALDKGYLGFPELVALPEGACLTAAWFWHCHKLNLLADAMLVDQITRKVNGRAMLHADRRRQITEEAVREFA
jgi:putative chitinase